MGEKAEKWKKPKKFKVKNLFNINLIIQITT
jgi:hypothetical protein